MPDTNTSVEEILETIAHKCICKYKVETDGVARVIGVCVCNIKKLKAEAKRDIQALLTERERLSRIDELTKLRPYETNKEQMPSSVIYNRIAHLSNPERGEKK